MELSAQAAQIISIIAFLFYGLFCLLSDKSIKEFKRYGLLPFRRLTGALEVLGALGLLIGFYYHPLLLLASAGLALLMFFGMMARLRIHDPLVALLPALVLFTINLFVFLQALGV